MKLRPKPSLQSYRRCGAHTHTNGKTLGYLGGAKPPFEKKDNNDQRDHPLRGGGGTRLGGAANFILRRKSRLVGSRDGRRGLVQYCKRAGGAFHRSVSLRGQARAGKETRRYDAPRSTALPTLAGTLMIDGERALSPSTVTGPRSAASLSLSDSPRRERPPQQLQAGKATSTMYTVSGQNKTTYPKKIK